jgi:hypothetical protein
MITANAVIIFSTLIVASTSAPTFEVQSIHEVPHLNEQLTPVSSRFDLTIGDFSSSSAYIRSTAILPIIITAISLGSWLILVICLLVKHFRGPFLCSPHNEPHPLKHNGSWVELQASERRRSLTFLGLSVTFLTISLLAVQGFLVGSKILTDGIHTVISRLGHISASIQTVAAQVASASSDGQVIIRNVNESSCLFNTHGSVLQSAATLASAAVKANSTVSSALMQATTILELTTDRLHTYGIVYKDYFVYACYALTMTTCVLFAFGFGFQRKWLCQLSSSPALLLVITLAVACGALLVAMVSVMPRSVRYISPLKIPN